MDASGAVPKPFFAVRSCLPITILIKPPDANTVAGNGTVTIRAEQNVIDGISVAVDDGVLVLSTQQSFRTSHIINVTITAASASNLSYVQNLGSGNIVVAPGFNVSEFWVTSQSLGAVYVYGLTALSIQTIANGFSTIFANGTFSAVGVTASDNSKVLLTGLKANGKATINADGIATIWIQGGEGSQISGNADQLARVYYTNGTCNLSNTLFSIFGIVSIFGDPCRQIVSTDSLPSLSPSFSCGLIVAGQSDCSGTGNYVGVPFDSTTGGPATADPSTSASGSGSTSGQSTTVSGPAGSVTTTTQTVGPGSSATAGGSASAPGQPPVTITSTSTGGIPSVSATSMGNQIFLPQPLRLPTYDGGLAVVSVDCADPAPAPLVAA